LSERFERLEEAIQICLQMWSDDNGPYDGRHYQLAETLCSPLPLQRPRPPILIGGSGETKTLRLVARYADACNLFGSSPEEVAHKLEVLQQHCEAESRARSEIDATMISSTNPLGDVDAFLVEMEEYANLGIDQVFISAPATDPVAWVSELGDRVIDRLAQIPSV
jgi:hypothetical protein